jgi:hypothetical protein
MKVHLQLLIATSCATALFFAGAVLGQTPSPSVAPRMKAIVYHNFGSPDVVRLEEIEESVPNDNQGLQKTRSAQCHRT